MKSFRQYLIEGISDIVYHKTNIVNAYSILTDNKFRLTASIGTSSEKSISKKFYYLSTARTPSSAYIAKDPYYGDLYFTLSGRKLGQRYKGYPIDYWGPTFRKADPTSNEMEDRIVSNDQYIDNALSYIKEVNILYGFEQSRKSILDNKETIEHKKVDDRQLKYIKKIYSFCKKNDIPIYIYNKKTDFLTGNKSKAIDILSILKDRDMFKPEKPRMSSKYRSGSISGWVELLNYPIERYENNFTKVTLGKEAKYNLEKRVWGYNKEESLRMFDNDIHNSKSKDIVGTLIDAMKRLHLKSTEDVMKYLINKYESYRKFIYR